jgi:hypothetical protein
LKETIAAQRDRMEKMQFDQSEIERNAFLKSKDEITQLKETIAAQRDKMEKMQSDRIQLDRNEVGHDEKAQEEINRLKQTILLRHSRIEKMEAERKTETQDTITDLRDPREKIPSEKKIKNGQRAMPKARAKRKPHFDDTQHIKLFGKT